MFFQSRHSMPLMNLLLPLLMTTWLFFINCDVRNCSDLPMCNCTVYKENRNVSGKWLISLDCTNADLKTLPVFNTTQDLKFSLMDFANNSLNIDKLSKKPFKGLKVEHLDLSHNNLNKIQFDSFTPLRRSLKTLVLNNVGLKFRNLNFLKPLGRLAYLSLKHNRDKEGLLRSGIFPEGIPLEYLDLSDNHFDNVELGVFRPIRGTLKTLKLENIGADITRLDYLSDLTQLEKLFLGRNNNTKQKYDVSISTEPFSGLNLRSLQLLNLTKCRIILMQENCFLGLENITSLDASYNNLRTIPKAIRRLTMLEYLNFDHNENIDHIPDMAFETTNRLKILKLSHTKIPYLSGKSFRGLELSLQELDLSHSKLVGGHFWVFAMRPLSSLRKLNIAYNKIDKFVNDTFDSLFSLEELDISGNMLQVPDFLDVFKPLSGSLTHFYIRNMTLSHIPVASLRELEQLEVLDLSYNMFNTLHDYFFAGIETKEIILTGCRISNVSIYAFKNIKSSIYLNLDNNFISNLSFVGAQSSGFFSKLSLVDNRLRCDCTNTAILYYANIPHLQGSCTKYDGSIMRLENVLANVNNLEYCKLIKSYVKNFAPQFNRGKCVELLTLMYMVFNFVYS